MIKNALFYENNYLSEFTSKVTNCIEENGKIKIVLSNTAFYPEGGGAPSDTGTINGIKVNHVEEKNDIIYHEVSEKIDVGEEVICKIDFDNRFSTMQAHSAEHIVSGLICKKYNANNVGFHMGQDFITMDFDVLLKEEDVRKIEKEANEAVYKNIEIKSNIYTKEEIKNIDYRSKKEINEDIRLVEVPGYDRCACCGVHVSKTGEIGIIKLLYVEKYKVGCRIYMLTGKKALQNYTEEYKIVDNIGSLLSLKHDEVYMGVQVLKEEVEILKKEKNKLKNEIFENEVKLLSQKDNIILFKENLSGDDIKLLCIKAKDKSNKISAVFSNNDGIYKFILMSDNTDLKEISNSFKNILNAKCGGNSVLVQGQVHSTKEQIIEFFEKI